MRRELGGLAAGALAVAVVTLVIWGLKPYVPVLSLGALYVLGVLPIAVFWGLPWAVAVSVASMLAFNWFFLPPVHTFTLADSRNWFALAVFVATGVVVSELAARMRRQARESSLLAEIATSLLEHGDVSEELDRIAAEAARALEVERATIVLGTQTEGEGGADAHELAAGGRRLGTIYLAGRRRGGAGARRRLLPALASLLGVAIDRERLAGEAFEAEALRRSDAMKTALLRAVSHDLRTPLMGILTSASALAQGELVLDEADRADLLATVLDEAHRLDRLVGNLLDLSRLQAGAAEPELELAAVDDLVDRGAGRAGRRRRQGRGHAGRRAGGRPGRLAPDPARAREPDRERPQVLAARRARPRSRRRHLVRGVRARDRPGPGRRDTRARADLRAVPARLRERRGARGRARAGDRAGLRRGERRQDLRRVALGPGRDVRAHAAGRAGRGRGMSGQRMLVVDDEEQILRALRTSLRGAGYEVETAATGEEALAAAAMRPPEAVILDLVLPDGTGIEVCRELRKWTSAPVIVLSAVGEEREKVAALDAGADDYVTKPVGIDELLARLRASLRRVAPSAEPLVVIGELEVDLEKQEVRVGGKPVHLTPHQFDLLRVFARNAGKLLTHRMILQEVWGPTYGSESNLLRVHVAHLRRKIEPDPARPRYLLTEPGAGYRLVDPATATSFTFSSRRGAEPSRALTTGRPTVETWARALLPRKSMYAGRGCLGRCARDCHGCPRRSSC